MSMECYSRMEIHEMPLELWSLARGYVRRDSDLAGALLRVTVRDEEVASVARAYNVDRKKLSRLRAGFRSVCRDWIKRRDEVRESVAPESEDAA